MQTQVTGIVTLLSMTLFAAGAVSAAAANEPNAVTLTIVESNVTDKTLEVRYRITNRSERDIWICESICSGLLGGLDYEVYLPEGGETLIVRRRLNVPGRTSIEFAMPPDSIYLRLPSGQQRDESIILPLPIPRATVFFHQPALGNALSVTRLRMEIGFHDSDLPDAAFSRFYEALRGKDRVAIGHYLGSHVEREQMLSAVADVPRITYAPEGMGSSPQPDWPKPPQLAPCTRVSVEYHPSMLEYFFPDPGEESLLNGPEKEFLRSQRTTDTDGSRHIAPLRHEIERGRWSLVVMEESRANVVCYADDKPLTSFAVYGDTRLLMQDGTQFTYAYPLAGLRALAPQIEPYALRTQRARVLKSFWYELRAWHRGTSDGAAKMPQEKVIRYPPVSTWNDAIKEAYLEAVRPNSTGEPYREGACEYAMNPDCTPDSPADMVLLFETHVGWNRHGGPELFTFENHNPSGGLVLLHDGTVKFVRTDEELRQLRWK